MTSYVNEFLQFLAHERDINFHQSEMRINTLGALLSLPDCGISYRGGKSIGIGKGYKGNGKGKADDLSLIHI